MELEYKFNINISNIEYNIDVTLVPNRYGISLLSDWKPNYLDDNIYDFYVYFPKKSIEWNKYEIDLYKLPDEFKLHCDNILKKYYNLIAFW